MLSGLQSPLGGGPASPSSSASSLPLPLVFPLSLKQAMFINLSGMRRPHLPGADPVLRSWLSLLFAGRPPTRAQSRGQAVTACHQAEHWACSLGLREADAKEFGAQDAYEGALRINHCGRGPGRISRGASQPQCRLSDSLHAGLCGWNGS